MNQDNQETDAVLEGLRSLSGQVRSLQAPPHVEEVLLKAFRKRQIQRRWREGWKWLYASAATAAVIIVAILALQPGPKQPVPPEIVTSEIATEYIPVSFVNSLNPGDFTSVVRISLPYGEMSKFGLPVQAELEQSRITADVLLGEDGIAKAIRFVH